MGDIFIKLTVNIRVSRRVTTRACWGVSRCVLNTQHASTTCACSRVDRFKYSLKYTLTNSAVAQRLCWSVHNSVRSGSIPGRDDFFLIFLYGKKILIEKCLKFYLQNIWISIKNNILGSDLGQMAQISSTKQLNFYLLKLNFNQKHLISNKCKFFGLNFNIVWNKSFE